MPPISIGLIVEGEDDRLSYEVFFKKIKPEINIISYPLYGCDKKKLVETFKILNRKLRQSSYSSVEKGLIIFDCDKKCAPERAGFIKQSLNLTNMPANIKIHATCTELETFFLTCIEDIKEIFGEKVKFKKIKKPESIQDPKKYLSKLLNEKNITYGKKVAEEIANQIDICTLRERSKNFNRLYEIVDNLK